MSGHAAQETRAEPAGVEKRTSNTLGGSISFCTTGGATQGVNAAGGIHPDHYTEGTGVTSIHSNEPHGSNVHTTDRDENRAITNAGGFGTSESSVSADPKSAQYPVQEQQGGGRPTDKPAGEQADAVKDEKDGCEKSMAKRDPNDNSGELLKMHDGSENGRSASIPGQSGGGEHGKQKGTGEQYVKSSGLNADGGDFDAANPGAGREARRLFERKDIKRTGAGDSKVEVSLSPSGEEKSSKPSMGTNIKEKLHIGRH